MYDMRNITFTFRIVNVRRVMSVSYHLAPLGEWPHVMPDRHEQALPI